MAYHVVGRLDDREKDLLQQAFAGASGQNEIQISFETEQMGSFDDREVIVINHRRTGLDEIADFVERTMLNPDRERHAILTHDESELDENSRADLASLTDRLSSRGVVIHENLQDFTSHVKSL